MKRKKKEQKLFCYLFDFHIHDSYHLHLGSVPTPASSLPGEALGPAVPAPGLRASRALAKACPTGFKTSVPNMTQSTGQMQHTHYRGSLPAGSHQRRRSSRDQGLCIPGVGKEPGREGGLERQTFLPDSLKRTLQNCQRGNRQAGRQGLSDPQQGIKTELRRMQSLPLSVQATVLCSAPQVTPVSHPHTTHRASHPGPLPCWSWVWL